MTIYKTKSRKGLGRLIAFLLVFLCLNANTLLVNGSTAQKSGSLRTFKVSKVLETTTLLLQNGRKVRLLGVDSIGDGSKGRAFDFARKLTEGRDVSLSYDEENNEKYHKDNQGRLIAYVWVLLPSDKDLSSIPESEHFIFDHINVQGNSDRPSVLLNGSMIRAGYAKAAGNDSYRFSQDFERYEKEAKEAKRGLW